MAKTPKSANYKLLRNMLSKLRQIDSTHDASYLVIYSFLYKYCSDMLKDHFIQTIREKEMTLDEAYRDEYQREMLREDGLKMFGYFITDPDYFIDEVIANKYSDRFFIYEFFTSLSEHMECEENSNYQKYFNFIFNTLNDEINFNKFEYEGETHLIVKEIIYDVFRLDIFEQTFPFQRVFDRVCESKLIGIESDPDYFNSISSEIILSNKREIGNLFNPFLNDASSLINLDFNYQYGFKETFAKTTDRMSYCVSLIKFFINYFDWDHVFLELESPANPIEMDATFDVIVSRVPGLKSRIFKWSSTSNNADIAKKTKRKEIVGFLADNLNLDEKSILDDDEFTKTVNTLLEKADFQKDSQNVFEGEYSILKDSEYLFLIDLIESLDDDGIMVLSMSQSFLSKNSLETLRKYLTLEMNCIDAIISIPDELSRPRRSEIVVIFRKNKLTDDIVFIDMSRDFETKKSPYAVSGLFSKRNLTLDGETLKKISEVHMKREKLDKFSNVVGVDEIAKNEFNLSISRYVDTFEGEFVRLEELKKEKREIDANLSELTERIDKMMDELGLRL